MTDESIEGEVVYPPGHPDYILDEEDINHIVAGRAPKGGVQGQPTTRMFQAMLREKREAEKLKLVEGYNKALAEVMPYVASIKASMLSIADEATLDPATGMRDWSDVKADRLSVLMKAIQSYEDRFLGKSTTKIEQTGKVDLIHQMAQIQREIEE